MLQVHLKKLFLGFEQFWGIILPFSIQAALFPSHIMHFPVLFQTKAKKPMDIVEYLDVC